MAFTGNPINRRELECNIDHDNLYIATLAFLAGILKKFKFEDDQCSKTKNAGSS